MTKDKNHLGAGMFILWVLVCLTLIWLGIRMGKELASDSCNIEGDAESLHWAYCDHMGYERMINYSYDEYENREHELICIFEDNTSCNTYDFYYETCGKDKIRPIKPRKMCEHVYVEFERCEEGLFPSEPKHLLDQPHCRK